MQNFLSGNKDSLSKKASYLRFSAKTLVENLKLGSFRSLYKGQGVEFSGVREYLRGDDVRAIDWNVTARMGRPYVKVFDEEHELQIFLVVDRSASMFCGVNGIVKYETVAETAALLALVAESSASPIGAVFFDGEIHFSCKPASGKERTMLLLSKLDKVEKIKEGSVLANAIQGATKLLKNRSLVFVISDFRSAGWEEPFKLLAQKNDVVALRVTDTFDFELPDMGSVPFVDSETGISCVLPTSTEGLKSAWKEDFKYRTQKWKDFCIRHGASPLSISTEEDVVRVLSSFFLGN